METNKDYTKQITETVNERLIELACKTGFVVGCIVVASLMLYLAYEEGKTNIQLKVYECRWNSLQTETQALLAEQRCEGVDAPLQCLYTLKYRDELANLKECLDGLYK